SRHLHINMRALARERGKRAGHHDGRNIGGAQVAVAGVDAETLEHADEALTREYGLAQRVARAVETDDQAIADQHIVAHAFEIGDVFDARSGKARLRPKTCKAGKADEGEERDREE